MRCTAGTDGPGRHRSARPEKQPTGARGMQPNPQPPSWGPGGPKLTPQGLVQHYRLLVSLLGNQTRAETGEVNS